MADETLTNAELAVLVTLMAEARGVTNKELEELGCPPLDGVRRKKLNDLKLVDSSRETGRSPFVHELTDDGWARCKEEMLGTRRKGKGRDAVAAALFAMLAGIGRHLARNNLGADQFFKYGGAPPEPEEEATSGVPDTPVSEDEIEARIRNAYAQLANRPGAWVSLTDLRPLLGDVAKADVDAALRAMALSRRASVVPQDDQKTLTDDDRAAAAKIGDKNYHLLAIEDA